MNDVLSRALFMLAGCVEPVRETGASLDPEDAQHLHDALLTCADLAQDLEARAASPSSIGELVAQARRELAEARREVAAGLHDVATTPVELPGVSDRIRRLGLVAGDRIAATMHDALARGLPERAP